MKRNILSFGIILMCLSIFFSSCTKEEVEEKIKEKGKVGISYKDISSLKADYDVSAVLISLVGPNGEKIYSNYRLNLYNFGGQYLSEELELETGNYQLTSFLVLDRNNDIVYVAPQQGSDQAKFVNRPLPIDFYVYENEYVEIAPEVIDINNCNCNAEAFGYAAFSFNIVDVCPGGLKYEGVLHYEIKSAVMPTYNFFVLKSGICKLYKGDVSFLVDSLDYIYNAELFEDVLDSCEDIGYVQDSFLIEEILSLHSKIQDWTFEKLEPSVCQEDISISKSVITPSTDGFYWHSLIATDKCFEQYLFLQDANAQEINMFMDEIMWSSLPLEYISIIYNKAETK